METQEVEKKEVEKAAEAKVETKVQDNDHKEFSNILKVKADDKDIEPEERKRKVKNLAGAIAHGLRQFGVVYVRCFSPATCFKASKAIAIARGFVAVQGFDLFTVVSFIETEMDGQMKTGICYECFSNKTDVKKVEEKKT
jgi:stage V sporulation protein S